MHVDVFGPQSTATAASTRPTSTTASTSTSTTTAASSARSSSTVANDNCEEGFDFNENHAGDLRVNLLLVEANGNREEGIDYEEDDDFAGGGDLVTAMTGVGEWERRRRWRRRSKIREKGDGDLERHAERHADTRTTPSAESASARTPPAASSSVTRRPSRGNDGHGIDFDENGDGT